MEKEKKSLKDIKSLSDIKTNRMPPNVIFHYLGYNKGGLVFTIDAHGYATSVAHIPNYIG